MERHELLGALGRMHFKMLIHSLLWGFIGGLAVLLLVRNVGMSFTRATWLGVGFGILFWFFALMAPMSFQVHKYLLPVFLPLLGAVLWGIVGMVGGYVIASLMRIIADVRRFVFMVEYRGRGPDPSQYNPTRDIVIRPLFGVVVTCVILAAVLEHLGVGAVNSGTGEFAAIIGSKVAQLPVFFLYWGMMRQLFESTVDVLTTPALWARSRH